MSINCHCHPNYYECPVLYGDIPDWNDKPHFPVPAIVCGAMVLPKEIVLLQYYEKEEDVFYVVHRWRKGQE